MSHPNAVLPSKKLSCTLMGIVNVTPDSFYDGGRYSAVDAAVRHARELAAQGADIIDIGGASSRPGARSVPQSEELQRVLPVIEEVTGCFKGPVSIDTTWSSVARAAIDAGATWINDISAGRCDPEMVPLAAGTGCTVVLMHSRGTPETMQNLAQYDDVVEEVTGELLESADTFIRGGVDKESLVLDPGIGFAKSAEHSLTLLRGMERIVALGYPVLVGTSRKSFIGHLTGKGVDGRLPGTLASAAAAYLGGARIFRVHDVAETVDFLKVLTELI
jgi:dihydropteroate synthase